MKHLEKRRMISGILVMAMTMVLAVPVNAKENTGSHKEIIVSEEYAKSQSLNNKLRYGENEKVTVVATEYKTTTVTPSGQPAGGYRLPKGSLVYVNTSGGPTTSVSFAVSWGVVSVGVGVGLASTNASIGGLGVALPDAAYYYTVKLEKRYKIERHKVDVYQYNEYKYTYYTDIPELYSVRAYAQRVY